MNEAQKKMLGEWFLKFCDWAFPTGHYLWYHAFMILWFGASLNFMLTITMLDLLDYGQTISTDTFIAAMPFATSHTQSPLSYQVIGFLSTLEGYMLQGFILFLVVSAGMELRVLLKKEPSP